MLNFKWEGLEIFLKNIDKLIYLIEQTLPATADALKKDFSLKNLAKITDPWKMENYKRLEATFQDKYSSFTPLILEFFSALGLRGNIKPTYKNYSAIIIFGTTGLSYFQIWQDLIQLVTQENIKFDSIYILGGDRKIHPQYDSLDTAYVYYPENFNRFLSQEEIITSGDEMGLMKLITPTLIVPSEFEDIPIYWIQAAGKTRSNGFHVQATTADSLIELINNQPFSKNSPLLFINTLPYIFRQGLQAKYYMPDHQVDICAYDHPYLETIDTPLKGKLPAALYLDELHWLLETLSVFQT